MIYIITNKNNIEIAGTETLVSGTANTVEVCFQLSSHWDEADKTAVFTNGHRTIAILEEAWLPGNICAIPHEVLAEPGRIVRVGLRGNKGGQIIFVTPMASLGSVIPGTNASGDVSADPVLPVWEQLRLELAKHTAPSATVLEKWKGDFSTNIRIRFRNPDSIPDGATLQLYRCVRYRNTTYHWNHPVNWDCIPSGSEQRWGYGLMAETTYQHTGDLEYPPVPEWMPHDGFMETEHTISAEEKADGFIDLDLSTYLLPLLKPVDKMLTFSDCGFVGMQRDGRNHCLLLRFRICKDGVPIDEPGDILCIGFRRGLKVDAKTKIVAGGHLNTALLYVSIR